LDSLPDKEVLIRDSEEHVSVRALALGLPDREVLICDSEEHVSVRALSLGLPDREVLSRYSAGHVAVRALALGLPTREGAGILTDVLDPWRRVAPVASTRALRRPCGGGHLCSLRAPSWERGLIGGRGRGGEGVFPLSAGSWLGSVGLEVVGMDQWAVLAGVRWGPQFTCTCPGDAGQGFM
jgi:hypothetical protein